MAHHHGGAPTQATPGARTIVLAGNPNVGKSVFFNALTGTYVDVSNFPGTTVELTRGRWDGADVVDSPGIYGVSSFNDEETVARDVILGADAVVNVVDAVHLGARPLPDAAAPGHGAAHGRRAQHGRRGAARGRAHRPRPARGPARRAGRRDGGDDRRGVRRAQEGDEASAARSRRPGTREGDRPHGGAGGQPLGGAARARGRRGGRRSVTGSSPATAARSSTCAAARASTTSAAT